jgi:DNA segregation ATPase FtsK/SpoIIIE-like protein
MDNEDPLYEQAKMIAKSADRLCIANLQRTLMIGYNRASRLMDSMIDDGLVERYETGYGGMGYKLVTHNV